MFQYKPISLSHKKGTSLFHHVCYFNSSPSTTSQIAGTHKTKLNSFFFFVYITNVYHPIILSHFIVSLHQLSSSNFIWNFLNILLLLCPFWILLWKYILFCISSFGFTIVSMDCIFVPKGEQALRPYTYWMFNQISRKQTTYIIFKAILQPLLLHLAELPKENKYAVVVLDRVYKGEIPYLMQEKM